MLKEKLSFEMGGGVTIYGDKISPENELHAKGALLVVHGMAEHRKRYYDFASFMASNNYVVYLYDQRGHGETAGSLENVGYMDDEDNYKVLVKDAKYMIDQIKMDNPDLPIFILGHSMGSFVTQSFIEEYSSFVQGAILSGSNYLKSGLFKVGHSLAKSIVRKKGRKYRSTFLNDLSFGSYNKAFKPTRTDFDWLSANENNVDAYIADPYCGGLFTSSYFMDLLNGFNDSAKNVKNVRKELPIFIISGSKDPVSNSSKNIKKLANSYTKNGIADVHVKLYEGKRHEIMNEDNRIEVFNDIYQWIEKHNNRIVIE